MSHADAMFYGIPVFEYRPPWPRQIRFPRSKRRRIQKKWRKAPKNWSRPSPAVEPGQCIMTGSCIVAGSLALRALREAARLESQRPPPPSPGPLLPSGGVSLTDLEKLLSQLPRRSLSPLDFTITRPMARGNGNVVVPWYIANPSWRVDW